VIFFLPLRNGRNIFISPPVCLTIDIYTGLVQNGQVVQNGDFKTEQLLSYLPAEPNMDDQLSQQ